MVGCHPPGAGYGLSHLVSGQLAGHEEAMCLALVELIEVKLELFETHRVDGPREGVRGLDDAGGHVVRHLGCKVPHAIKQGSGRGPRSKPGEHPGHALPAEQLMIGSRLDQSVAEQACPGAGRK